MASESFDFWRRREVDKTFRFCLQECDRIGSTRFARTILFARTARSR